MNIDYILQNHGIGGGSGTSKDKTPPPPCTNFTATSGNAQVVLAWVNPVDTDFVGVKILRKEGSYPTSPTDGVLVYSGANTSYTDTTVTNGTQYFYHAFTFDYDNNFNTTESGQEATATPVNATIYGVKIDTTNSNPETAVTYINDSIGFTKALGNNGVFNYGSWADKFPFNQIKPCLLLNGVVNYCLSPTDYTKKADGVTASDITSGTAGDVMIEFPKIYWKFETIGTDLYIRYSDIQIDSTYKCLAHMRGTTEKDKCYISAYLGNSLSSKLRSLSGKTPTVSQTLSQFRTLAQTNGINYDQLGYFQYLMLQVLFIVMFKNRDSQIALGRGNVDASSLKPTGGTNGKEMFYGETTGKLQNKFCGIEDIWGNLRTFVDGFMADGSRNILLGNQSFADGGTYVNHGQASIADTPAGYISAVQGTTETGFIPKTVDGSVTTYYCDNGTVWSGCIPVFGDAYRSGSSCGIFKAFITYYTTSTGDDIGSRLMYL